MSKRKIQPLSPDEAAKEAIDNIPDFVIEVVNFLLKEKLCRGYATLRRDDIIKEIMKRYPTVQRQEIFDKRWLDFEPIFEEAGWNIVYDQPGYNENYEATFAFTDKRKR